MSALVPSEEERAQNFTTPVAFPFAGESEEECEESPQTVTVCDLNFRITLAENESNSAKKTLFATHLWQVSGRFLNCLMISSIICDLSSSRVLEF